MNTIYKANSGCVPSTQEIHLSLGAYGRLTHQQAIQLALSSTPREPLLGYLSTKRLQICPQNLGQFTSELALQLKTELAHIEFRCHANVHIERQHKIVDIADWPKEQAWFKQMAHLSHVLDAPVYTAHAGKRGTCSVAEVLQFTQEIEDLFGIPVGVEGHYPTPNGKQHWLISTWVEYQQLLESGVNYALDLSHLNILAVQTNHVEWSLVHELLSSPHCLEIHLSDNHGYGDQHLPLSNPDALPWWWSLLSSANPNATIFSEGRQNLPSAIIA